MLTARAALFHPVLWTFIITQLMSQAQGIQKRMTWSLTSRCLQSRGGDVLANPINSCHFGVGATAVCFQSRSTTLQERFC